MIAAASGGVKILKLIVITAIATATGGCCSSADRPELDKLFAQPTQQVLDELVAGSDGSSVALGIGLLELYAEWEVHEYTTGRAIIHISGLRPPGEIRDSKYGLIGGSVVQLEIHNPAIIEWARKEPGVLRKGPARERR